MTRPECPNCLRPMAENVTHDDVARRHRGPNPMECADRLLPSGDLSCVRPAEFVATSAEIRDLINERDRTRDELATTAGVAAEQEAEIRDLCAGFAATWAEVERLRANLDMMHMDAVARHHGEKERTARLRHECEYWEARCKGETARLTRERDEALDRVQHSHQWYGVRLRRLRQMAEERGFLREFCSIVANGTADVHEPPSYEQQLNLQKFRADKAEAELATAVGLLFECREYLPDAQDSIYGNYCGGDPRDFAPDRDCCTPAELEAHRVACEAAKRGEPFEAVAHHHDVIDVPGLGTGVASFAGSFGVGIRTVRDPGLERLHAAIDNLLGKDPDHG